MDMRGNDRSTSQGTLPKKRRLPDSAREVH